MTSVRLLRDGAICWKNLSAFVALKSLSFVAPILGIDPLPGLTGQGLHGVLVSLNGGEPVLDALLDGVGRRGVNARIELVVELVELLLDLGPGSTADRWAIALAVAVEAERHRADVVAVGPIPPDTVVPTVAAASFRFV